MSTEVAKRDSQAEQIERVLITGDLAKLTADERLSYYRSLCESVGLNPLTKPFEYITLNNKLTLYTRKDATDQLRALHDISITIVAREVVEECYVVTSRATKPSGRTDESIGAVPIGALKGEARCNAMMKAETKSKRRVTLSISGLGMLDELEVETIPSARPPVAVTTEDIVIDGEPPADKPKSNGKRAASVVPSTPVAGAAEREAAASAPAIEYATREQIDYLRMKFAEVLLPKYKAHADQFRRDWLAANGYKDAKGVGTSKVIPRDLFKAVAKECLKNAETINELDKSA